MAFATPIRDMDLVEMLRSIRERHMGGDEWRQVEKAFAKYFLDEDNEYCHLPKDEIFDGQRHLRNTLRSRWVDGRPHGQDQISSQEPEQPRTMGYSHIPIVMKWYNVSKGYGFGEGGLGEDVFVHYALLAQAGIQDLHTGDTLICDVTVSQQGKLQAIAIHSFDRGVETSVSQSAPKRVVEGKVQFYNPDRAFGFIRSQAVDEDIYFSAKALERGGLRDIKAETVVWARVEPGRFGKGTAATIVAASPISESDAGGTSPVIPN
jgi:CspA family cold shock protein